MRHALKMRLLGLVYAFGYWLTQWATGHGWYSGRHRTDTKKKQQLWQQIASTPVPPQADYDRTLITVDSEAGRELKKRNGMGDHEMMRKAKQILAGQG